jgi:serine/threonine-protein kinase
VVPQAGEAVGAILNGQWKLTRLIGEGGLAAVYEAHGQQQQGRRAIKILHPQFVSQRQIVERFYAEAKACFSLRHPHIALVEAYAYAEDGSPYIVMELLEGVSLEAYLRKKVPMPPDKAAPILYGILQALSVAHQRGIVHRDLKPANIFLVPLERGEFVVKVLDFGIAKVMDVAGGMGSKTRTGAVLGTPGYMSPEQVKNAKAVDARTDLWAAGVVFYEMLTCLHPFGSSDQLARMVAVLRDPPTPISKNAPHLAAWDPFFDKALARDPDKRFQSAEEMAERLRAEVQGTPARFVPDGLQTVTLPIMPDQIQRRPSAPPPTGASPGTMGSAMAGSAMAGSPMAVSVVAPAPQLPHEPPASAGTHVSPQYAQAPHTPRQPDYAPPQQHAPQQPQQRTQPQQAQPEPPPVQVYPRHSSMPPPQLPHHPTMQSTPPPMLPSGTTGGPSTQISDAPARTPTYMANVPLVAVETAPDEEPPSLVWWGVVLVGLGTFAIGTLVGYLLAY